MPGSIEQTAIAEEPLMNQLVPDEQTISVTTETPRKSTAWKWVVGAFAILTLCIVAFCGVMAMSMMLPQRPGQQAWFPVGENIALIHITGIIAGTGGEFDGVVTPERVLSQLDQAVADPTVQAILLRIDSPGGTVAASQEIAIELARASEEKPVVVSVGDVAASGAYMIAAQADEIVASPTSAIGSIGVVTQIPNVAGLLDKLGIEFTILTAGEYKGAGSMFRSLTPTETALIQTEVDVAYEEFIRVVAEGRDMTEDEVREMATGFAWSAILAKEMGLVDKLGTYNDAVDRAAELGGIVGEPGIVTYDDLRYDTLIDLLLGVSASFENLRSFQQLLANPVAQPLPR